MTRAMLKQVRAIVPFKVLSPIAVLYDGIYRETGKNASDCAIIVKFCCFETIVTRLECKVRANVLGELVLTSAINSGLDRNPKSGLGPETRAVSPLDLGAIGRRGLTPTRAPEPSTNIRNASIRSVHLNPPVLIRRPWIRSGNRVPPIPAPAYREECISP